MVGGAVAVGAGSGGDGGLQNGRQEGRGELLKAVASTGTAAEAGRERRQRQARVRFCFRALASWQSLRRAWTAAGLAAGR